MEQSSGTEALNRCAPNKEAQWLEVKRFNWPSHQSSMSFVRTLKHV